MNFLPHENEYSAGLPNKPVYIILIAKVNSMTIAKHIVFCGYVQGVGFRFTAKNIAKRYDLKGFVRNLEDGKVEVHLQGEPEDIDDCIEDLKDSFTIRKVEIEDADINTSFEDFGIAL
jgi:acylphosphatase